MTIQRFDVGTRLSEMAVHHGVCYLAGQVAGDATQDIRGQTRQVLAAIDALLARAGSDKSRLLMCQIFITDLADFPGMNEVWEAWLPTGPGAAARHRAGAVGQAAVEGGDGGHGRSGMTHSRRSIFGLILMLLAVSAGTQWWAGHSQARLGDKMAALAQPGDIQMLSSNTCAFCTVARASGCSSTAWPSASVSSRPTRPAQRSSKPRARPARRCCWCAASRRSASMRSACSTR